MIGDIPAKACTGIELTIPASKKRLKLTYLYLS